MRRLNDSYLATSTGVSELVFAQEDDTCTRKVNRVALERGGDYKALMFVGDDHVFDGPGWDKALLEPLLERPGISFPDAISRPGHPEVFAISSVIVQALGWMMLPSQQHYYVDDAILELGVRADCITFLPEVKVPHLHYKVLGQPPDEIYRRAHKWLDEDRESYWRWLREDSQDDVDKVNWAVYWTVSSHA